MSDFDPFEPTINDRHYYEPVNESLTSTPPHEEDSDMTKTKRASDHEFVIDPGAAAEAIAAMTADIQAMEWELACSLRYANSHGLSWARLGEQIGMTKQGAQQFAKRAMQRGTPFDLWTEAETEAAARRLNARQRAVRWQLRRIVSGKVGVSRVVRETISTHFNRALAEEKGVSIPDAELWRLAPDGTESQVLQWRAAHATRVRRRHAARTPDGDDAF